MPVTERYILMLEDDPDDRYLTSSVLESLEINVPLRFLSNTKELITTLETSTPILILTDFNLNPETGLDILEKIKAHSSFQHIPVVVLGDTNDDNFIAKCYRKGASTYAIKPSSIEATSNKIRLFFNYWLEVAETPQPTAAKSKA
jgi:CheY-like chemotaxis protein